MKRYLKYILPLVYILYAGCISMCYHTHVVDGVRIVHSHPFSDDAQHSHTNSELSLINDIADSNLTDYIPATAAIPFILISLTFLPAPAGESFSFIRKEDTNPLRGPPCLIHS